MRPLRARLPPPLCFRKKPNALARPHVHESALAGPRWRRRRLCSSDDPARHSRAVVHHTLARPVCHPLASVRHPCTPHRHPQPSCRPALRISPLAANGHAAGRSAFVERRLDIPSAGHPDVCRRAPEPLRERHYVFASAAARPPPRLGATCRPALVAWRLQLPRSRQAQHMPCRSNLWLHGMRKMIAEPTIVVLLLASCGRSRRCERGLGASLALDTCEECPEGYSGVAWETFFCVKAKRSLSSLLAHTKHRARLYTVATLISMARILAERR